MSKPKTSEPERLKDADTALTNALKQPKIKELLAKKGYGETELTEGRTIYDAAKAAYDFNKQENDETSTASLDFKNKRNALTDIYKEEREIAEIAFNDDEAILIKLGIVGRIPQRYPNLILKAEKFYNQLGNAKVLPRLARFEITQNTITQRKQQLQELIAARKLYEQEYAESQQATRDKNDAFDDLKKWMHDFKTIAKIALKKHPELLEALGFFVRS